MQTVPLFYGMWAAGSLLGRRGSKSLTCKSKTMPTLMLSPKPKPPLSVQTGAAKNKTSREGEALFVFQFNANADALR
ncbi:MAG TPA: hypothetical protein VHV99_01590 [Paraburkholderia sp.]|nr:hypothetical protein [Paraburkholderia sp.]